MKINDLYENSGEKFNTALEKDIFDILMMFKSNGANKTDINNIVVELDRHGNSISPDTVKEVIEDSKYYEIVEDDKIRLIDDSNEDAEENAEKASEDNPEVNSEKAYNPAKDKAREAVRKRMKR